MKKTNVSSFIKILSLGLFVLLVLGGCDLLALAGGQTQGAKERFDLLAEDLNVSTTKRGTNWVNDIKRHFSFTINDELDWWNNKFPTSGRTYRFENVWAVGNFVTADLRVGSSRYSVTATVISYNNVTKISSLTIEDYIKTGNPYPVDEEDLSIP